MRVFGIQTDGRFQEYVQAPFQLKHEEAVLEDWLESNPDGILEDDKVLIIGRQVTTNLGGFVDLLGLDRYGDVVVMELKMGRTPRDTIAQALEYASFAEHLDSAQLELILQSYLNDESLSLAVYHREYFQLLQDEAVAFNKDQHIVVVGQSITRQINQTAAYLCTKGLKVTCVEFTFFESSEGKPLLSQEVVVAPGSSRPGMVASASLPVVTKDTFLASLDADGRAVFLPILDFARDSLMPIHWGTKGFSLNVSVDGTHVAICYGYPPQSVFKQSVYTALAGQGGMSSKTAIPEHAWNGLWEEAKSTGLFVPAGRELKCPIDRSFSESDISHLLDWCTNVSEAVTNYGLKE